MNWIINDLLLNFLFLLFFLLFIPLILDQTNLSGITKRRILILSSCLAVISSISFPISNGVEGHIYDLRYVAMIIGGLYGGFPAIISIWITTVIYRLLFGGIGALINLIIATLFGLSVFSLLKKFKTASKYKRLFIGTSFAIVSSLIVYYYIGYTINDYITLNGFTYIISQSIAVLIILYITEIMLENKRARLRTEKMDLVSQLASSISHEVRNPLTVVRGFLQLIIQMDVSQEKRKEYLTIAIDEIDRANNIIGDYLTFARPSSKEIEYLDVEIELNRSVDVITPLANMNSVAIEIYTQPLVIVGERQLFQQCLLNITKNCIEAMPNGGLLRLKARQEKNHVIIQISDTGKGMTDEQKRRLGEPYFTTKGKKGTGLGMMTVFRIIEVMNGTIQFTSEVNRGTTFFLKLPLATKNKVHEETAVTKE